MTTTIGFIGGGNMAESLIGGLLASGRDSADLLVAEPDPSRRARLADRYSVTTMLDNHAVAAAADVLVLAVKPQVLCAVAEDLARTVQQRHPLIVSIAAGIRSRDLEAWLGGDIPLVRAMPNTPALVRAGATGLFANTLVDDVQRNTAETLMRSVGTTVWLDKEDLMDVVTALSGSGPAFFFRVMEALEAASTEAGLPPETSRLLVIETALGAAKLALEAGEAPAQLRRKVTSPGGTTAAGLEALERGDVGSLFHDAIFAATGRSREMADEFGGRS